MAQTQRLDADVVVVGGATTGLYFGGLMARQGKRVIICDCSLPEGLVEWAKTADVLAMIITLSALLCTNVLQNAS